MNKTNRDDKASVLKPALSERGSVQALSLCQEASHFGAARDERDGPSPLQDDVRCLFLREETDQGGTVEDFSPLTAVRGVSFCFFSIRYRGRRSGAPPHHACVHCVVRGTV